ncbi:MAG: hypothetical protein AAF264_00465 [Pseudomonadota bacterium]
MAVQYRLPGLLPQEPADPCRLGPGHALWSFPNVPPETLCAQANLLGCAGEALVDSLLLRYGLIPLAVPAGLAVDRVVVHPNGLFRMQIKTTATRRADGYAINAERGYRGSPQGRRGYDADDYDMLAIVALPDDVVRFTTEVRSRHRICLSEVPGLRADPRASLEAALIRIGLDPDADDLSPPCAA